jgi:hypothetical protein
LRDLHADVLERNHCVADGIASVLHQAVPLCGAVGYV